MSNLWYDVVAPDYALTQGDLIFRCPTLAWDPIKPVIVSTAGDEERLKECIVSYKTDVVVLTQACDLENQKVRNVVLCPHRALPEVHTAWQNRMQQMAQTPSARAWRRYCEDIADGYVWNQVFLNGFQADAVSTNGIRVIDFHELFTIPREFLESLLRQRDEQRLRLRPPYREHLSQSFARFFMRVGLPQPVDPAW